MDNSSHENINSGKNAASMEYIESILQNPQRKLVVASNDIDLYSNTNNTIFILAVQESRGSAGGRGGGSGSRRIEAVYGFICKDNNCYTIFETTIPDKIEQFEIPYSAVAMDITLSNRTKLVVQGLVDQQLVNSYLVLTNKLK